MASPSNHFARVAAPDPQSVTVTIRQEGNSAIGEVAGPAPPAGTDQPALSLGRDGSLGAHQALAVGCQLANELGRDVVVIDEGGVWRPAWGHLEQG
jgi:hypothetical protein